MSFIPFFCWCRPETCLKRGCWVWSQCGTSLKCLMPTRSSRSCCSARAWVRNRRWAPSRLMRWISGTTHLFSTFSTFHVPISHFYSFFQHFIFLFHIFIPFFNISCSYFTFLFLFYNFHVPISPDITFTPFLSRV